MLGNLHAIALQVIPAINPQVPATIQFNQGTDIGPDGSVAPTYSAPFPVLAQVQALTFRDIQQIQGLNLQGTRRAIYLFGDVEGLVRVTNQGGDLITIPGPIGGFPANTVWLTAQALETWGITPDGWCKIAATLQDGS